MTLHSEILNLVTYCFPINLLSVDNSNNSNNNSDNCTGGWSSSDI